MNKIFYDEKLKALSQLINELKKCDDKLKKTSNKSDVKKLEESINLSNTKFNNKLKKLSVIEQVLDSQLSFSDIKTIFENISVDLFQSKKGREHIKDFIKIINENKLLNNLYIIQENIVNSNDKIIDPVGFISEATSFVGKVDKKNYNENLATLNVLLKESLELLDTEVIIEKSTKSNINEAIDYIFLNDKTIKNLAIYSNKINEISEFVKSKETINEDLETDINKLLDDANINENNIININSSNNANDTLLAFNENKKTCINLLDENILKCDDPNEREKLFEIKKKIENKVYESNNAIDDNLKLIKLKNILNNNE